MTLWKPAQWVQWCAVSICIAALVCAFFSREVVFSLLGVLMILATIIGLPAWWGKRCVVMGMCFFLVWWRAGVQVESTVLPNSGAVTLRGTIIKQSFTQGVISDTVALQERDGHTQRGIVRLTCAGGCPYVMGQEIFVRCILARSIPFIPMRVCAVEEDLPVVASSSFLKKARAVFSAGRDGPFPSPVAEFFAGLFVGSSAVPIPRTVADDFRRVGLSHILAFSGYNIGLVVQGMEGTLQWCIPFFLRHITLFFGVWGATAIAGGGGSIGRAAWMASGVIFARLVGRPGAAAHLLLMTTAVLCIIDPVGTVTDPGAVLSILATTALVWYEPVLTKRFFSSDSPPWLWQWIAPSLVVCAWTTPYVLWQFGGTSLLSVPMTLVLSPLIPALSVWAGAWFLINAVVPLSGWICLVAAWPGMVILFLIHHVARENWVYFFVQQFPWWGMGVWWMLLYILTRPRFSVVQSSFSFTSPDGWDILVV